MTEEPTEEETPSATTLAAHSQRWLASAPFEVAEAGTTVGLVVSGSNPTRIVCCSALSGTLVLGELEFSGKSISASK